MSGHVYRRARIATASRGELRDADTWGTIVTPDELQALLGLDEDEAVRVAALVQLTIEAYIWPNVIAEPVPPPVHVVGLALAARFSGAATSRGGAVVGESVGSYSYRLDRPLTFDDILTVLGELADALSPWAPPRHDDACTLEGWTTVPWPAEWWQRDLDRIYLEAWP